MEFYLSKMVVIVSWVKKQGESALNSHVLLLLMLQMHKCFNNKSINQFTSLFMSK